MSACIGMGCEDELDILIEEGRIAVKVPAEFSDMQCLPALEELLKLSDDYAPTDWLIDLSELESISLPLASMLLGFGEEARKAGCNVRFTGIPNAVFRSLPRKQDWVRCFGVEGAIHEGECELTLQSF